jgi:hypothetical protein
MLMCVMCRDRLYGFENTGQEFLNSLQGWVSNSVSVESHQGQCQIAHDYLKPIEHKLRFSEKGFYFMISRFVIGWNFLSGSSWTPWMKWAKGPVQKVSAYRGEVKLFIIYNYMCLNKKTSRFIFLGKALPISQTDSQTDRQTDRPTDTQSGGHRQTDRQTGWHSYIQTARHMDIHTYRQTGR